MHAERGPIVEVAAHELGQESQGDHDVGDVVAAQELDGVLHAGLAAQRHHRLGLIAGQRPQPCAFSARHDDGTHYAPPWLACYRPLC